MFFLVLLNKLWIWFVLILINIFIKFELLIEKNGVLVLFVIVLVSNVLLVFGGLISKIFLGILDFIFLNFLLFFKKLIILINFCFFLFVFVILEKWIWCLLLLYIFVLDLLKFIIWLLLLLFCVWFRKKINNNVMIIIGINVESIFIKIFCFFFFLIVNFILFCFLVVLVIFCNFFLLLYKIVDE